MAYAAAPAPAPAAAPAAEAKSCMICMDDAFNKTTKTATECLFCHEVICRTCLKQTLLNDTAVDICCPGCRAVWSQEFMVTSLPITFRTGDLKKHREKVLFDREKVRLPAHMDDARRYKEAIEGVTPLRHQLKALKERYIAIPIVTEYKKQKAALRAIKGYGTDYATAYTAMTTAERAMSGDAEITTLRREVHLLKLRMRAFNRTITTMGVEAPGAAAAGGGGGGDGGGGAEPETRQRRMIMACPAAGCAGFVDTLWKCGICDIKVCKDCRVIKTAGTEHACNADDVSTARAIAAETKPCPKCAASISKVSGCDQMWCTLCHTTFSWNTGKVETAVVHNPHYFQWLAANGHALPRADLPGMACDVDGNITRTMTRLYTNGHQIRDMEARRTRLRLLDRIAERHRQRLDMEDGELRRIRRRVRDYLGEDWRREMCIKRLAGAMSEEDWRIALQRAEKAHHKERAWLQLMEMYAVTTRDIIGRITVDDAVSHETLTDILAQHDQLHQFVYEQNLAISKAYGCIVIKITPDMKAPETKKREPKAKVAVGGAGAASAVDIDETD